MRKESTAQVRTAVSAYLLQILDEFLGEHTISHENIPDDLIIRMTRVLILLALPREAFGDMLNVVNENSEGGTSHRALSLSSSTPVCYQDRQTKLGADLAALPPVHRQTNTDDEVEHVRTLRVVPGKSSTWDPVRRKWQVRRVAKKLGPEYSALAGPFQPQSYPPARPGVQTKYYYPQGKK